MAAHRTWRPFPEASNSRLSRCDRWRLNSSHRQPAAKICAKMRCSNSAIVSAVRRKTANEEKWPSTMPRYQRRERQWPSKKSVEAATAAQVAPRDTTQRVQLHLPQAVRGLPRQTDLFAQTSDKHLPPQHQPVVLVRALPASNKAHHRYHEMFNRAEREIRTAAHHLDPTQARREARARDTRTAGNHSHKFHAHSPTARPSSRQAACSSLPYRNRSPLTSRRPHQAHRLLLRVMVSRPRKLRSLPSLLRPARTTCGCQPCRRPML